MKSKVTITDIAQRAGVSIATVSRIINHKAPVTASTQKKVLQAMEELQYDASHIQEHTPSNALLTFIPDFANPFYAPIIDGIQQTARENGYEVFLMQTKDIYIDYNSYCQLVKNGNFRGVLWLSAVPPVDLLQELSRICPMAMCCEYPENFDISYVSVDDVSAAYRAVNYLISSGCRRIGFVNCSLKYKYARHRREGYLKALDNAGLSYHPEWSVSLPNINYNLAYSAVLQVLNSPNVPDAFFACSDVYAIAAINAAHHCGLRIPEDLSVIGVDNVETSRITTPSITTIGQPTFQMGQQGCAMLIDKINNPHLASQKLLMDTELIIRDSTRKFF